MARKPRGVGRGGPRAGTPGTAYPNRSDLQSPGGLPYGQAQQLQQSGQAMQAAAAATAPPRPAGPPPGLAQPFNRPTERPNEPLTAGMPFGPGPGREAIQQPPGQPGDVGSALRGLLLASNNPDVAALITLWEQRQSNALNTANPNQNTP